MQVVNVCLKALKSQNYYYFFFLKIATKRLFS